MRTDRLCRIDDLDKMAALDSTRVNVVADIKKFAKQRVMRTAGGRSTYATPKLKVFGPVGALTQSGSTGGNEMAPMLSANMR